MNILRIVVGLILATIGVGVVLAAILGIVFALAAPRTYFVPLAVVRVLVAVLVIVAVVFAFRKAMGPTPRDDDGA